MAQPNDSTNIVKVFLTDNTHWGIAEDKIYSIISHQNTEPLGVYPYFLETVRPLA